MGEEVNNLTDRADNQEQYSKRNSLRITGIAEPVIGEYVVDVAIKTLNNRLQINPPLILQDMDPVHRVRSKIENKTRLYPRKICHTQRTPKIYKLKATMNTHDSDIPKIYIDEDLTQFRATLMWKARNLKRDKKIEDCWSVDGQIFV